ncbi:MAG: molybdopterin molybdotransferase MoeA [Isosphaeraceae bacterium]
MRGFRVRTSVEDLHTLIRRRIQALDPESLDVVRASGRVLVDKVVARQPVPSFDRAAMDGYAVRGEETFGASAYDRALFTLKGIARPGHPFSGDVGPGEAVEIATGSPIPHGADAVVKVESTEREGHIVSVFEPTPPGRHVGRRGEDVEAGTVVLPAGRVLRPQDLGILKALGCSSVTVVRSPRVAVLSTGDELLPSGTMPHSCLIADSNSVMLAALVARDGGIAQVVGPLLDNRDLIRATVASAVGSFDAVLISGGSSTGPEDHAPGIVAELGELAVHGVSLRPASPAGLGFLGTVPVLLLPGNPVSCLCAYDFFGGPIVRLLGGRPFGWPYHRKRLPLNSKLASALGRVDYARVRVREGKVEPLAISGASILSSTSRADGFVVVPAGMEGYPAGAEVVVWFYDTLDPENVTMNE